MRLPRNSLCVFALAAVFVAGCRTTPELYSPFETTKYTIENTDKFVVTDPTLQTEVTCTGLQERILPDGRMEVVANVRNRGQRPVQVQVDCVFKNEQGASTGDETPFRGLTLGGNETKAVKFESANNLARRYTIRAR